MMELQEQRPDDIIDARAQTTASHDPRCCFTRVEIQFGSRTRPLEQQFLAVLGRAFAQNVRRDPASLADSAVQRRWEFGLTQILYLHGARVKLAGDCVNSSTCTPSLQAVISVLEEIDPSSPQLSGVHVPCQIE